jgi:hypothetical protein
MQFSTFENPIRLIAPQQLRKREGIDPRVLFRQTQEGDRREFIGGFDPRYPPPLWNVKRNSIQVPYVRDYYSAV